MLEIGWRFCTAPWRAPNRGQESGSARKGLQIVLYNHYIRVQNMAVVSVGRTLAPSDLRLLTAAPRRQVTGHIPYRRCRRYGCIRSQSHRPSFRSKKYSTSIPLWQKSRIYIQFNHTYIRLRDAIKFTISTTMVTVL